MVELQEHEAGRHAAARAGPRARARAQRARRARARPARVHTALTHRHTRRNIQNQNEADKRAAVQLSTPGKRKLINTSTKRLYYIMPTESKLDL